MKEEDRKNFLGGLILGALLGGSGMALLAKRVKAAPPEVPPELPPEVPLEELVEKLEEVISSFKELVTALKELALIPAVLSLPAPLTHRELVAMHKAIYPKERGRWQFFARQFIFFVPAFSTTTIPFRVDDGWVALTYHPCRITSDYYSRHIRIICRVGDVFITRPAGEPLTEPADLPVEDVIPIFPEERVYISIINATATDIFITCSFMTTWIERSYCEEYYIPWLSYRLRRLKELRDRRLI